jgi:hypothetical protein
MNGWSNLGVALSAFKEKNTPPFSQGVCSQAVSLSWTKDEASVSDSR